MEISVAASPVHTFELIDEDGAFNLADGDGERKRIGLSFAGERAHDCQAAGAVVTHIGEHESGPALGLLAADFRIEIQKDDVAGFRNV